MIQLVINFFFITGVIVVGAWLETIGGKSGAIDEWLTPLPLGISGLALVFLERVIA